MKKLIAANGIRAARARGEQEMSVVPCASIIIPKAREVAELPGVIISECEESASTAAASATVDDGKTESQRIRKTTITQLPGGQFIESLVAQPTGKITKEKQSLEQGGIQPSLNSVTDKGGVRAIDGNSVKFGCFNGTQPHCMGLTDLVANQDGSSIAAGSTQQDNVFSPWTPNHGEVDMIPESELHVCHEGETVIAEAGGAMFTPKGSSIGFGTPPAVKSLYVA